MAYLIPNKPDPWATLRLHTNARIGLGRAGAAITTADHLAFQLAHAQARDAVHDPLDRAAVTGSLAEAGFTPVDVRTMASDRQTYLARPDLGRRLAPESQDRLAPLTGDYDLAFVIADGLSATAVHNHAVELLRRTLAEPDLAGWRIAPVAVVEQGRVAVGDEIGAILGARLVVILLGERPGLSSPDSLGAYLTWNPAIGRTDAERNCVSNIRPQGLGYAQAAETLARLLGQARRRGISGVALKDEAPGETKIAGHKGPAISTR